MAFVTDHNPGAPCWFELGTSDQDAAKSFYSDLFGWTAVDQPMGPGQNYTIFQLQDRDVTSAYTIHKPGLVPNWGVYFAVSDVDASAQQVLALGGALLQPPFDVMSNGRMAICEDPGGAVFSLWQAKDTKGVGVFGDENSVCWVELATWDVPQARDFYTALFGWTSNPSGNMPTYLEYSVAGHPTGGLLPMDDNWKGMPSHWAIYFKVADCAGIVEKAKQLGGSLVFGPFQAPGVGMIALISDPQGAKFYVILLG
jgi:predicted enzyme related to lactoylglutathione lyase